MGKDRLITPDIRLGMLTPSSNSVLEPVLSRMMTSLPDLSVHYGRFQVTEISLSTSALAQFDSEPMLGAATLLADAKVASICWNGTSAGWLGFERDRSLIDSIRGRTGIPATSSVLALDQLLRRRGLRRIAFVTPYTDDVQARILGNFEQEGYACVAERHVGERVNFAFSTISPSRISALAHEVAMAKPDAIIVFCTNMWGALVAEDLEAELGIPVLDTVATALWGSLLEANRSPARVSGWGQLFSW